MIIWAIILGIFIMALAIENEVIRFILLVLGVVVAFTTYKVLFI